MRRLLLLFCLSICFVSVFAQENIYFVQFSDKLGTPYSLSRPEDFLSERAILRRQKYSIAIDSTDLPVSPA